MTSNEEPVQAKDICVGDQVDIRTLMRISGDEGTEVVLYWEEGMGRAARYEADLVDYGHLPEENRPFITINAFLKYLSETYTMFPKSLDELLAEIPITIEITAVRKYTPHGETEPGTLIAGLMPFRDEMEP